jgi:hypothetical protein
MMRHFFYLLFVIISPFCLNAQTDNHAVSQERYVSPALLNLQHEESEVAYYSHHLKLLKAAFAEKNISEIIVHESAVVMALRNEVDQLSLKIAANSAQMERRKLAGSGTITQAAKPEEAPARDPFAEASTPDEARYETMSYTLAAFDRHAFDPGRPEDAARDFEKLDKVQKIMEEALAELKSARQ